MAPPPGKSPAPLGLIILSIFASALAIASLFTAAYLSLHHLQTVLPLFTFSPTGPPFDNFAPFLTNHPSINATRVSADPPIWTFDKFLSEDETAHLLAFGSLGMFPSGVSGKGSWKAVLGREMSGARKSSSTIIPTRLTKTIRGVENRIADLTGIPWYHGEPLQLIRYYVGERYTRHFDFFPEHKTKFIRMGGNRVATVLLYLSDVTEGGETAFEELRSGAFDGGFCPENGAGLVRAVRGRALLWYNHNPRTLKPDRRTMHAGRPVVNGTKYVVSRWLSFRMWLLF